MLGKIILTLVIMSSYIVSASNIFIITDRKLDKDERKFIKYLSNKKRGTEKVYNIYPQKKSRVGTVIFEHLTTAKAIEVALKKTLSTNVLKTLNTLGEDNNLKKGDKILIFSNLYYKKSIESQNIVIDFEKKMPNDGFITSDLSPFKAFLNRSKNPNNKFKGTNILIITDNNQPLKYINHMHRFYYYFASQLGSTLKFYGNTGCEARMKMKSCDRLKDFFFMKNISNNFTALETSGALQLIDIQTDTIDNVGADLSALPL